MEANQSQNKIVEFAKTNRSYIIAGVAIILLGIYFTSRGDEAGQQNETSPPPASQQSADSTSNPSEPDQPPVAPNAQNAGNTGSQSATGDVMATGTLKSSDNAAKGNYIIDSNRGKIYLHTKRDYTQLLGKQVDLSATGDIKNFTGAKLAEAGKAATPATTTSSTSTAPSSEPATGTVKITGTLKSSDDASKGNYVIDAPEGKIYLSSKRDYSAWVNGTVTLTAQGTVNSFSGAVLTK